MGLMCASVVVQDSEGREQALSSKMAGKQGEQGELAGRVADCQGRLEGKVQDLRNLAEAKQQVSPALSSTTAQS